MNKVGNPEVLGTLPNGKIKHIKCKNNERNIYKIRTKSMKTLTPSLSSGELMISRNFAFVFFF